MKTISKVLMAAKDFSGRYILMNDGLLETLGYTHEKQVLGRDEYDLANELNSDAIGGPDALAEQFLSEDEIAFRGEELNLVYAHRTRGQLRFFISNKIPYRNERQKIIGAVHADYEIINPSINLLTHYLTCDEENFIVSEESRNHIQWYIGELQKFIVLNKRELECVDHLAKGCTAKEIARRLDLSHRTIESYLDNAKKKLNCANAHELITKCYVNGWLNVSI